MSYYVFKRPRINIIIIVFIFVNISINRNINNDNIIINLLIIDQIPCFVNVYNFINKKKRKCYRDNNFCFYNKYINYIVANCFL